MIYRTLLRMTCALALLASPVMATPAEDRQILDGLYGALAAELPFSGVVRIESGQGLNYERAFNHDALSAHPTIETDSAFMVASLTKSFSAVLVLSQVEAGHIALDATIAQYLPDFAAPYASQVTVRQLLQNRSGIPHYTAIPGWFEPETKDQFTAESFLAAIAALELQFTPGAQYLYSNANYYLLGLILEAATGRSYESLLNDTLIEPLGLEHTGQIYAAGSQSVAPTFIRDGDSFEQIHISNPALFKATASMYSTAEDLAQFGKALTTGSLLGDEMRAVLLDPEHPMGFTVDKVELGEEAMPVITYNGELAGTASMLTVLPEQSLSIVVLANSNLGYDELVMLTFATAEMLLAQ